MIHELPFESEISGASACAWDLYHNPPKVQMCLKEFYNTTTDLKMTFLARVQKHDAMLLVDSGATHFHLYRDIICKSCLRKVRFHVEEIK